MERRLFLPSSLATNVRVKTPISNPMIKADQAVDGVANIMLFFIAEDSTRA